MSAGRDDVTGRWLKGNRGNPNGRTSDQRAKLAAMVAAVSTADAVAIICAQVAKAKDGDTKAAEFVCDRVFGRPVVQAELCGPDGGALITIREVLVERKRDA